MEGPCMRLPRLSLDKPVELQIGKQWVQNQSRANNLSIGGLFLRRNSLPVGAVVHVRIAGAHPFEADGQVRHATAGTGIGFVNLSEASRAALNELIEELASREPLAA